ncbi:MAG: S-layer homology domain-containing protein [Ruminiclostridium sp.]|nr:S-layer homology domain-containing protein [Ruminiclostridium sp.]
MKHHARRITSTLLVLVMLLGLFPVASFAAVTYDGDTYGFSATKITHPEKDVGRGNVDGIVDYLGNGSITAKDQGQGDRGQSYSWAAIGYGDYIYVSTCYGAATSTITLMGGPLGNSFDQESMNKMLDTLYNGDFYTGEPDGGNPGGLLAKIHAETGEVTILMSKSVDGNSPLFRNCCEYNGKLYFCGSVNNIPQVWQIDPETDDSCKAVYTGMTLADYGAGYVKGICTGIRGIGVFQDQLIISCVRLTEDKSAADPIILSSTDGENFELIADKKALFNYPACNYEDSIYGGSIWEMVEFNNSLYVSICTGTPYNRPNSDYNRMQSFAIVRGDYDAETGGWTWTPVVGDQEKDGARYTFGIDPERTRAGAGVLCVYGDYLYIGEYNDEEIPLIRLLFDMDPDFFNANLEQSVSLYRMDKDENMELVMGDPTEMFPSSLSGIDSGFGHRENQYIWRMQVYDGRLYIGTFDTTSLLEPLAQLFNGDMRDWTGKQWMTQLQFIQDLLDLQTKTNTPEEGTQDVDTLVDTLTELPEEELPEVMENAQEIADSSVSTYSLRPNAPFNIFEGLDNAPSMELDDPRQAISDLFDLIHGMMELGMRLRNSERGFDMYVTEDGTSFNTITTNGFGDPYNHGLRVFAETNAGLAIGTANPFYGTQVWLMDIPDEISAFYSATVKGSRADNNGSGSYQAGETVTISAGHRNGYTFSGWIASSDEVVFRNGNRTVTTFVMPAEDVTITATWTKDASPQPPKPSTPSEPITPPTPSTPTFTNPFRDVSSDDWFYGNVMYVAENGLMTGTADDLFSPQQTTSRGMIVTILYRLEGSPAVTATCPFSDVAPGSYYENAITWAADNQIVNGMGGDIFAPNNNISREQMAAILWRYASWKGCDVSDSANLQAFADAASVQSYAVPAMQWAVAEGLINGTDGNLFPANPATRAQTAAILHRFCENVL